MDIFLPVLAGGAALVAWQSRQSGPVVPAAPVPSQVPLAGSNTSAPIGRKMTMMANVGQLVAVGGKGQSSLATPTYTPSPLVSGGTSADAAIRQQIHALEDRAREEYNRLEREARERAAAELNKMQPSPGLTGDETFEEAARKIGAAIGATVGVAACNAIPIPGVAVVLAHTACATLGAIVFGYLGGKLGEWAKKIYSDVKAWGDKQWESIQGAAEDVGDAVSDGVKAVGDFIGGLW